MADVHDRQAIGKIVSDLILLERDATAAYVRIVHRLVDAASREKIAEFVEVRQRRLGELTRMSFALRFGAPEESAARHYLSTGRITIDGLMTDSAILEAMRAGEEETVAAYERASARPEATQKNRTMFGRFVNDARMHRSWIESAAQAL